MKRRYLFVLLFLPILAQAQESQFQIIDSLNQKISNPDALSKQLPVVNRQNPNNLFAYDSLPEIQQLEILSQHRQHLIDSLQNLDLPDEISNYLDSLTQIPSIDSRYAEKVKELQDIGLDSLSITRQLQEWLSNEQEGLSENLLPEDFTEKLSKYKSEPWSQKAQEMIGSKQSE